MNGNLEASGPTAPQLPPVPAERPDNLLASQDDLRRLVEGKTALLDAEKAKQQGLAAVNDAHRAQPISPKTPWLTEGMAEDKLAEEIVEPPKPEGEEVLQ